MRTRPTQRHSERKTSSSNLPTLGARGEVARSRSCGFKEPPGPKRDHLVQWRRSVADLTESLPKNARKTLPVKGIGMNGTVHVDLLVRWLRHLYRNGNYMLDLESTIT
jgi:hypothetical protein